MKASETAKNKKKRYNGRYYRRKPAASGKDKAATATRAVTGDTDSLKIFHDHLDHLKEEHRLRVIPGEVPATQVDFLSNDYLGLGSEAEKYREEFFTRFPDAAFTSSASRLLSRANKYHTRLEQYLEDLYGRPALLFNSGYHANIGIIQALAVPGTLFLADKLVHASAIDGLRLSGTDFKRFPHNDLRKLRRLIKENYASYERIIVIAESIYSMDGDTLDLKELVNIKREYPKVMLYVDEAHSFGVRGTRGLGLAEESGVIDEVDIIIGTLGKAAASAGAFAVTSPVMKQYLINSARSLIFSTAIPPAQAAWSILMIEKLTAMNDRRLHIQRLSRYLVSELERRLNFETTSNSQIVPLIIGDASEAVIMADFLSEKGFDTLAIRRPTVPAGSERLRFSINAALTERDIDNLITALSHYR